MPDGKLVFSTKIDNSDVPKDLKNLERQIKRSQESISKAQNAKLPLVEQAEQLNKRLIEAKQHLESLKNDLSAAKEAMLPGTDPENYIRASADLPILEDAIKNSEKDVEELQKEWDKVNNKIEKYNEKIQQANTNIEQATQKASELQAQLATPNQLRTAQAMEKAEKSAHKFNRRLREIVRSALIFNLISSGLRSVVNYMGAALKSNSQYTAQLAQLKGAWLTAFQPIYDFVLPGLLAIMRILTAIGNALAAVLSFFSGKTATQSAKNAEALNKQATAIGGVGDAAEEAQKQLMGFDEINRLESTSVNTGGGSGGGTSGVVQPDFSGITDMEDELLQILGIVAAIAAGLLTWKIASMFTDNLKLAAGLGIAVGGAMLYAFNWADAFANGIDWDNLAGMLTGMIILAAGLGLAFGSVGAAVGLLIGSVGLIVLSLIEFSKTGEVTDEMLVALAAAFIGVGVAISLLTGNWIPLIIGLVLGIGTAFGITSDQIREAVEIAISWILALWDALQQLVAHWNEFWGTISSYQTTGTIGDVSGWNVPAVSSMDVPALARGAVLPANKPFLAMVGDQRNGTNVEAPLETIKQALEEVMAQYGGGDIQITFTGELAALGRVLAPVVTKAQKNNDRGQGR